MTPAGRSAAGADAGGVARRATLRRRGLAGVLPRGRPRLCRVSSGAPDWTPRSFAGQRHAWIGTADATRRDSHRGRVSPRRPVFFVSVTSGESAACTHGQLRACPRRRCRVRAHRPHSESGIVLAIRNARTGLRADRRGATRLAVAISLVVLTSGVLESRGDAFVVFRLSEVRQSRLLRA